MADETPSTPAPTPSNQNDSDNQGNPDNQNNSDNQGDTDNQNNSNNQNDSNNQTEPTPEEIQQARQEAQQTQFEESYTNNFPNYGIDSASDRNISSGNIFVMNAGVSPVPSFNFMLRVEGVMDLPCKSIKAFSREVEFEIIQEGGLNDYVHMRRKPISKPFYIEVERYIGIDYVDPLPLGAELMLPLVLIVSRRAGQFYPMVSARTYFFTGCTVTKKTYGEMNAEQSGLFVETTTIAYREMMCTDAPWSEAVTDAIDGSNAKNAVSAPPKPHAPTAFDTKYASGHVVDTFDESITKPEEALEKPREKTAFDEKYEDGHVVDTFDESITKPEEALEKPRENTAFDEKYKGGHVVDTFDESITKPEEALEKPRENTAFDEKYEGGHVVDTFDENLTDPEDTLEKPRENTAFDEKYEGGYRVNTSAPPSEPSSFHGSEEVDGFNESREANDTPATEYQS